MTMVVWLLLAGALDLQWQAPDDCVAPDLSLLASSNGRAVVRVERPSPATWTLDLTFLEPFSATRRLELSSCQDVRRAARALLVLGLKGAEAFRATEPSPPPVVPAEPPAPTPEPSRALEVTVRLAPVASFGSVPSASARVAAGVELQLASLAVGLTARAGFPSVFEAGPITTARVTLWPVLGGEASACWAPRWRQLAFGACASLALEWWRVQGGGVSDPARGDAAWLALGPLARLAWKPSALELGLSVAGRAAVRRPTAVFDGVEAVAAPLLSFEASAFVGWTFGAPAK